MLTQQGEPGSPSRRPPSRCLEFSLRISESTLQRCFAGLVAVNAVLIFVTAMLDIEHPLAADIETLDLLDLKREANIAVWYSSALLLLTGTAALVVASRVSTLERNARLLRYMWAVIAVSFLWLSVDETATLHERAARYFSYRVGSVPNLTDGGSPVYAWLLIFLPFIMLFLVGIATVARWSFRVSRRGGLLAAAGTACWIGVLGAELVEAQLARWSMKRGLQAAAEEGLEIFGTTFFLFAFLDLLRATGTMPPKLAFAPLGDGTVSPPVRNR